MSRSSNTYILKLRSLLVALKSMPKCKLYEFFSTELLLSVVVTVVDVAIDIHLLSLLSVVTVVVISVVAAVESYVLLLLSS